MCVTTLWWATILRGVELLPKPVRIEAINLSSNEESLLCCSSKITCLAATSLKLLLLLWLLQTQLKVPDQLHWPGPSRGMILAWDARDPGFNSRLIREKESNIVWLGGNGRKKVIYLVLSYSFNATKKWGKRQAKEPDECCQIRKTSKHKEN